MLEPISIYISAYTKHLVFESLNTSSLQLIIDFCAQGHELVIEDGKITNVYFLY